MQGQSCVCGILNLPSGTSGQWNSDTHRFVFLSNELLGAKKNCPAQLHCCIGLAEYLKKRLGFSWYVLHLGWGRYAALQPMLA